jgi:hypothetical protein
VSPEIVSILVLVAIFILATTLPVNMGVLAFAAAVLVGSLVAGLTADDLFAVFPGDLFIVLVGVTYLFGIAQVNGTVDWLVHLAAAASADTWRRYRGSCSAWLRCSRRSEPPAPPRSRSSPQSRSASPPSTASARCSWGCSLFTGLKSAGSPRSASTA